jgi:hypothetical protein
MATIHVAKGVDAQLTTVIARTTVVALTLATAAIHTSLGGLLFLMNAAAYSTLALAMVLPGPFGRFRWLIRLALIGFTSATIGGWVLFGARYPVAYLDKAIEATLLVTVAVDVWHTDGGPIQVVRRLRTLAAGLVRTLAPRSQP